MLSRVLELKRDQILVLIMKDFKLKYNSTALGFAWSLLVPILSSLVYFFAFGFIMRFRAPNYLLYLLCGTFFWQFFSNVVTQNGRCLISNASLLKKTCFERRLLVWGTFFVESIHFLLTVPILFVTMLLYGVKPDLLTLLPNFVVCCGLLTLFSMGLSYAYAAANIYFRDLERMVGIIMRLWIYLTPIFIPETVIPQKYQWIYVVNPMAGMVRIWRDIFYLPGIHVNLWIQLLPTCLAVFLLGRWLFIHLEKRFADMV